MRVVKCRKPLKLHNNGDLEIAFLGSGTAFGKELYNTNFIIIKGNTHLLVDFGMTGPIALRNSLGLDISEIENVLITHSHADHIGGLEFLALYNRYVVQKDKNKPRLKIIISENYQKILWDMSLRGGLEWNETGTEGQMLSFTDYFEPVRPRLITNNPRLTMELDFQGLHIELFSTNHIPENVSNPEKAFTSYGLLVDNRIFISGDTKFDSELLDAYKDRTDFFFHDCSFFPNPVHASINQLRELPDSLKRRMFLMHYGDKYQNHDISGFAGLARQSYRYIF